MAIRELVLCLNNGFTMLDLLQNVFDCFGPHERLGVLVRVDQNSQIHSEEDQAL
jgi:hypothetical protein